MLSRWCIKEEMVKIMGLVAMICLYEVKRRTPPVMPDKISSQNMVILTEQAVGHFLGRTLECTLLISIVANV
ncbi:hypothetical protein SUGI_0569690 [Cryptomeria japonica]|nr:hypothetical protein SUGI_0569690 [Cryptomeria japonica]